jgi:hypothetical protein
MLYTLFDLLKFGLLFLSAGLALIVVSVLIVRAIVVVGTFIHKLFGWEI